MLVEGNSDDYYKNVDESFHITNQLPADRFEVWYMSYQGKPKDWYRVDRFLHKVPYSQVPDVYRQCHILIKSSILESFSYPPLEMMATGGCVVVGAGLERADVRGGHVGGGGVADHSGGDDHEAHDFFRESARS